MWYVAAALTAALGLNAGPPVTDVGHDRNGHVIRVASEVFVQQSGGLLPALRQRPADAPPLPQTPESGGPARTGAVATPPQAAGAAPQAAGRTVTPESGPAADSVTANAAQSAVSCGPQNASSKECYSATQQYRSPAR
jgi:hypothetical protein